MYDGLLLEGTLAEYEAAFAAADTSGNGTLGANELRSLFASLGAPLSMDKIADVMMRYDADESGQIEFFEFLSMFRDQLLDLRQIEDWLARRGEDGGGPNGGSGALIEAEEGAVSLVFSGEEVEEALAAAGNADKLVVLMVGLTWCRPCKGVQKPVERLADKYFKSSSFLKLYGNANEKCKKLISDLKVRSTPAFLFYRNGEFILGGGRFWVWFICYVVFVSVHQKNHCWGGRQASAPPPQNPTPPQPPPPLTPSS